MTDIGARILEARRRRGMSQKALADAIGVTVQAVSQWENGKTDPSPRVEKLSAVLHCDSDWLLGSVGEGPEIEEEEEVIELTGHVPLVGFQDIPYFLSFLNQKPVIVAENYLSSTVEPIGTLFAIMSPYDTKDFNKGDILVFDNGIEAVAGDHAAILIFDNAFSQIAAIRDAQALKKVVTGAVAKIEIPPKNTNSSVSHMAIALDEGGQQIDRSVVVVATLVEHRKFRSRALNVTPEAT